MLPVLFRGPPETQARASSSRLTALKEDNSGFFEGTL